MLPASASRHYRRLQRLQATTIAGVRRAWRRMEPRGSWERQYQQQVGPQVAALVAASQIAAAQESDGYMAEVLNELAFGPPARPGVVRVRGFAGIAGDGRSVAGLLEQAVPRARVTLAGADQSLDLDAALADALAEGERFMELVTETILADTARAAETAALAARPWVDGYIRVLSPPSCSRCAILAGRFYLWNEGFARHPRCDCYHVPSPPAGPERDRLMAVESPDRYFDSLAEAEQDRIFTKAGAQAIRDGADIAQVVNARRGMEKAQVYGRDVTVTTAGTSRRPGAGPRLMPESIYVIASGDRDEAIRLLRLNGFIN